MSSDDRMVPPPAIPAVHDVDFRDDLVSNERLTLFQRLAIAQRKAPPFWGTFIGIGAFMLVWSVERGAQDSFLNYIGCFLIVCAGLAPAYLWSRDPQRVGLPIFAVYGATYVWSFGMPLLDRHPVVLTYPPETRFVAALWVTAHLVLSTWFWWRRTQRPTPPPKRIRIVWSGNSDVLFFGLMVLGILYELSLAMNFFPFSGELVPVARAVCSGGATAGIIGLAYRMGERDWTPMHRIGFFILFVVYELVVVSSLFLVTGMAAFAGAVLGFVLSRKKVPWVALVLGGAMFGLLHLGKESMRRDYWGEFGQHQPTPTEYYDFYSDWVARGLTRMEEREDELSSEFQSSRTIVGRASLLHLFLLTYTHAGEDIDYLLGDSYEPIPSLLIPRVLWPDKPWTHEGTYRLNIAYHLQDRESTQNTTIGWGYFNEAWANFGPLGLVLLAWFMAWAFSSAERFSRGVPLNSLRALIGFGFCMFALNNEGAMSIFITASFQACIGMMAFVPLTRRVEVVGYDPSNGLFDMLKLRLPEPK